MDDSELSLRSRWRFSLLYAFEVLTIIAVSLALNRDPKLPVTAALALVWSAASGAYLGYRWRGSDDFSSCARLTIGLSALIAFLNALAIGVILGMRAERAGGYYSFTWRSHLPLIFAMAVFAALIGMTLGGIFGAAAAYWREARKSHRSV
jgi:Na+/H+ antiporter NhaC